MSNVIFMKGKKEMSPIEARDDLTKSTKKSEEIVSQFLIEQGQITEEFIELLKLNSVKILDELLKKHGANKIDASLPNFVVNASPAFLEQFGIFMKNRKVEKKRRETIIKEICSVTIKAMEIQKQEMLKQLEEES